MSADSHRQHVALRQMQYAIRGRAEQQLQAVSAVTADDDQVDLVFRGNAHDLAFGRHAPWGIGPFAWMQCAEFTLRAKT